MEIQLLTDYEKTRLTDRQPLPDRYLRLPDAEMQLRIAAAKAALGDRLVILGHHYQRDEVIQFADVTGDSLRLSQFAAARGDADYIVFCGVHFMAESADVLSAPHQQVILPDLAAGCSMADMAAIDQLEMCWQEMRTLGARSVVPVTYINSAAAIKGFCGEHGGIVCTSSNAARVMEWAWSEGDQMLMLPDQHLGRNTAYRMGVPLDQMAVWDPDLPYGGLTRESVQPRAADSVEGALQRPHALQRQADRAVPQDTSVGQGHRAPGVHVRCRPGGRRVRLDGAHHPHRQGEPGGIGVGGRHRNPPRQPTGQGSRARPARSSRSTRSDACARRCSAFRRIICCGCSKDSSTARSTTELSSTSRRRDLRGSRWIECFTAI